nr:formin-like protein 5 [Aegilops tauschii subsp. strangulata]
MGSTCHWKRKRIHLIFTTPPPVPSRGRAAPSSVPTTATGRPDLDRRPSRPRLRQRPVIAVAAPRARQGTPPVPPLRPAEERPAAMRRWVSIFSELALPPTPPARAHADQPQLTNRPPRTFSPGTTSPPPSSSRSSRIEASPLVAYPKPGLRPCP